ncbi:hypothetical protein [Actinoplanes sp. DH11]|uniref:hypothetical protein n=1 Tax=Actinoplanes sp. DH11 TaxID=2857011 RepID=UPI001E5C7D9F|nr:hypothetical protein [Actinoplanes sp. DH11]
MARHLPVARTDTRVIHYVDATMRADLQQLTPAELATRQAQQRALYLRWKQRQEAIAERDRKFRQFWTGFGAVLALVLLVLVAVAVWWLWTVLALGVFAIPLVIAGAIAAAAGGHRCITIVQHMH